MAGRMTPSVSSIFFARGVVAFGFDGEQVVGEVAHAGLHFGDVDGEGAVGIDDEGALVGEVVELQRHALAVRLGDAEAHRAEGGGQEGGVELALVVRAVHQLVVVQVLAA